MKKIIPILTIALALIARPTSAQAGDEVWAAAGGLITGIILNNAYKNHQHQHQHHYVSHYQSCNPQPSHHHHYKKKRYRHSSRHHAGHYEYRTVKKWIPGYWSHRYDSCGHSYRVWNDGYYTYSKVKVWVSGHGHHH